MAYSHDQNGEFAVLDLAEDPVVAHTISPEAGQFCLQSLPETARITRASHSLIEIGDNLLLSLPSEPL